MGRFVDSLIAYRILKLLVTPFDKTDAYKLGIIDAKGKELKRMQELNSVNERDAYTLLHRLVFRIKKIIFNDAEILLGEKLANELKNQKDLISQNESNRQRVKNNNNQRNSSNSSGSCYYCARTFSKADGFIKGSGFEKPTTSWSIFDNFNPKLAPP